LRRGCLGRGGWGWAMFEGKGGGVVRPGGTIHGMEDGLVVPVLSRLRLFLSIFPDQCLLSTRVLTQLSSIASEPIDLYMISNSRALPSIGIYHIGPRAPNCGSSNGHPNPESSRFSASSCSPSSELIGQHHLLRSGKIDLGKAGEA